MKKLLLLLCALGILGVDVAWATTITWTSGYSAQGDKVNLTWIGLKVPEGVTEGTYNMSLDLCMWPSGDAASARSTYIGIFNAKNATAGNLVGFSENKPAITADGYVTWIFKSLNLTGGETYYLYFFESKDSYTTTTNRVALTAKGNTYSPAMCWKGTEYTNYAPLFKAAISDAGQPIVYQTHNAAASKLYPGTFYNNYGTSSVTEDNANWDNLWVSNTCPVQVAVKCNQNYISGYNGYFQATLTEATYTIKALGQYKIKGIRLTGLAERDGGGDCTVTITKPDATTATFNQSDGTTVMIDQTLGTAATSTTFKVQCDQSDGRVKNVELVVLVESDDNKISTISDLGVYNIKLVAGDYYISSSSKVTTTDASAANIQFISTGTANQYYLYDVDQKKFYKDVSPDTRTEAAALSLDYSIDNATTFNLREDKIPYQYIIEPSNSTNSNCLIAWAKANDRVIANYTWYSDQYLWELKSVSYDSKALIASYMDASFTTNLNYAGTVGYPTKDSPSYVLLKNLTDSIKNTDLADTWRYNADIYTRLQSYYSEYLAETQITMPEDGKTYAFINYFVDGTYKYLYNGGSTLDIGTYTSTLPSTAYFVAHKGLNGKYFFVAKGTTKHFVLADGSNKTLTDEYSSTFSPIEIIKMPKSGDFTDAQFFGSVYFMGVRRGDEKIDNGVLIVNYSTNSYNKYHTNPAYSAGNYSTAFIIQKISDEVEAGYNIVNMRQAGTHSYATTYLPLAVTLQGNMKAYKATRDGDVLRMTKIADASDEENNVLPALTPAVLWSENAEVTGNTLLPFVTSSAEAITSDLQGTLRDDTAISGTGYGLSGNSEGAGFYPISGTTAPTCKAYLDVPASVKSFSFDFGGLADGINTVQGEEGMVNGSEIYNLAGQRMQKLQKGVNIVNGKKVLIK